MFEISPTLLGRLGFHRGRDSGWRGKAARCPGAGARGLPWSIEQGPHLSNPGAGGRGWRERERDKERERESNPGVGERGWRERGIRPGMGTELGPRTEPCSAAVASNVQSPGLVEIETVWI